MASAAAFFAADSWGHPGAAAVHACVDVAGKLADLRADRVHDESGFRDAPADVGVVGVGCLVLYRAARRHVLGGDLDGALADALVGGGQEDLEVGEDAEMTGSALGPGSVIVRMRSSGTVTPRRRVVMDWVARMPSVSQSSLIE